jgi:hypothetical protein
VDVHPPHRQQTGHGNTAAFAALSVLGGAAGLVLGARRDGLVGRAARRSLVDVGAAARALAIRLEPNWEPAEVPSELRERHVVQSMRSVGTARGGGRMESVSSIACPGMSPNHGRAG